MQPGDLIADRYDLQSPIGEGGMAQVWKAHDRHLGRMVAVKIIDAALTRDPGFLVRFFSEAQAVARINHPNVIEILDFGEVDGRPYLVLEVADGGTVSDIVDHAPVAAATAAGLIAGAAAGAGAAHDIGVVHRDIKPSNVLVDKRGEPRLADFGIASTTGGESMTATGAALGSPHYISPEQARGLDTTPASDVYSLGIVLYQLLSGRLPFDGDNATAIAIAHVERQPDPPSTIVKTVPPGLEAVVMRCLEKDPAARFPDGRALGYALAGWLTTNHGPARVGTVAGGATRSLSTARKGAAAAAVAVVIALSAFAVASPRDGDTDGLGPKVGFEGGLPEGGPTSPSPQPTDVDEDDSAVVAAPTPTVDDTNKDDARSKRQRDRRSRTRSPRPGDDRETEDPAEPSPTPTATEPADPTTEPEPSPSSTTEQDNDVAQQQNETEPSPPGPAPSPSERT